MASLQKLDEMPRRLSVHDQPERSPLHDASANGNYVQCMTLLESESSGVNVVDHWGRTPLHLAARGGFPAIATLLLFYGSCAKTEDRDGKTPLYHVVEYAASCRFFDPREEASYLDLMKKLIAAGVDLDARDIHTGRTALHIAAREGTRAMAQILVDAGADVEALDGRRSHGRIFNSSGTPWEGGISSRLRLEDGQVTDNTSAPGCTWGPTRTTLLSGRREPDEFDRQRCPPPRPKPKNGQPPRARSPSIKSSLSEATTLVANEGVYM